MFKFMIRELQNNHLSRNLSTIRFCSKIVKLKDLLKEIKSIVLKEKLEVVTI